MTTTISHASTERQASLRRYRRLRSLRFVLALLLGCAIGFAEHREWLPPICTELVRLERITPAIVGPCILQTLTIPMMFLCALSQSTYFYVSRCYLFVFWILHGVDLLSAALRAPITLIPLAFIIAIMMSLLSRADTVSAAGIKTNAFPDGTPLLAYFCSMLRLWGGLLICQLLFYVILISAI